MAKWSEERKQAYKEKINFLHKVEEHNGEVVPEVEERSGINDWDKQDKIDTTLYTEVRSNLNVFQQGKFTNTITIGCGYVFNATQNLMFETTTGIEYSISKKIHANIFFGTYFFSGKSAASNNNFFGLSLVRFFPKKKMK